VKRRADRVAPEVHRVRGDVRGARFRAGDATFPLFEFFCREVASDGPGSFFLRVARAGSRRLF